MKGKGKLVLDGRSGCAVEILKRPEVTLVRKRSMSEHYNERLIIQANKQQSFIPRSIFLAPKVFLHNTIGSDTYFEMEYVPGEKYSDYLTRISKQDLDSLIQRIFNYLEYNLVESEYDICNSDLFIKKAEQIREALIRKGQINEYVNNVIENLINDVPYGNIPLGYCHGDFTFSNMIFFNGKVYLIDFLDSFVNSPLIDIVKLRQDTCFKWTLLIDHDTDMYKKDKTWQIMNYIDECIVSNFQNNSYYNMWYSYLQKFNLIRILPYISDIKETELVIESLKTL